MADIETIGIRFDPRPARAGQESAARGAREMADGISGSLRRVDDAAARTGQRWTILGQTAPRSMVLIGDAAERATTTTRRALSGMAGSITDTSARFRIMAQQIPPSFVLIGEAARRAAEETRRATDRMRSDAERSGLTWQQVARRIQSAVQRMVQQITQGMGLAQSATQRMVDAIRKGFDLAGSAFVRLGSISQRMLQQLTQGLGLVQVAMQRMADAVRRGVELAGSALSRLGGIGQRMAQLLTQSMGLAQMGVQRMADAVRRGVELASGAFGRLGAVSQRMVQLITRSMTLAQGSVQRMAEAVVRGANLAGAAFGRLGEAGQRLVQRIAQSMTLSQASVQRMADAVRRGVELAGAAFGRLGGLAASSMQRVIQAATRMRAGVETAMEAIRRSVERAGAALNALGARFSGLGGRIAAAGGVITRGISGAIGSLTRLAGIFPLVGQAASRMAANLGAAVDALMGMLGAFGGLSGAAGGGITAIAALVTGLGALVLVAGAVAVAIAGLVVGIGALVVAYKAATIAVSTLREAMNLAGPVQQSMLSFQAMSGTMKESARVMEELRAQARATGADLEGSSSTVKRFMALNFAADDAIKLNKNILDVAGSIGLSASQAALLGKALADVQAKGVVSMEELRQQIAEKGVPIMEEMQRKTGLWGKAFFDAVANAEVPSSALIEIFMNMEGGLARFVGGAERMTRTLPGAIDRLKANWRDLLITMGLPLNEAVAPILNTISDELAKMSDKALQVGTYLADGIKLAWEVVKAGDGMEGLRLAFEAATEFLGNAANTALTIAFYKASEYGIKIFAGAIEGTVKLLADLLSWSITSIAEFIRVALGGAYVDVTNKYKEGGITATEYLGVVIKNTLGQAFEDVLNAFLDAFKSVIVSIAKALVELSKFLPGASTLEKINGGKTVEPSLDWIPKINTHTDQQLPTRAEMVTTDPETRRNIEDFSKAAQALAGAFMGKPMADAMLSIDPMAVLDKQPVKLTDLIKMDFAERPTTAQDTLKDFLGAYSIPETEKFPDSNYTAPPKPPEEVEPLIQKARKVNDQETNRMLTDVQKLMMEWSNFDEMLNKVAAGTMVSVANNMTDAITSIIDGTKDAKTAFADMATAIIGDIMRMITQMLIQLAIARLLQAAGVPVPVANQLAGSVNSSPYEQGTGPFRSDAWIPAGGDNYKPNPNWTGATTAAATSTTAQASYHAGGVVQPKVSVPRFHVGGVSSGEAMAKVEKGETILTRRRADEIEGELRSRRGENKKEKSEGSKATIINVFDKSEIIDIVASNPDAVMNAISRRLPAIRKMVIGGARL